MIFYEYQNTISDSQLVNQDLCLTKRATVNTPNPCNPWFLKQATHRCIRQFMHSVLCIYLTSYNGLVFTESFVSYGILS